jgi:ABC-type lipoprotein export system ATPase subunit
VVITHDHDVASQLPRRVHILDGRIESDERLVPLGDTDVPGADATLAEEGQP